MEKITTDFISNPDKDETVVVHKVEFAADFWDALEELKQNESAHGTDEMQLKALIPGIVIEKYCFDKGISWAEFWSDKKHMKEVCNDPALSAFRVTPGEV